MVEQLKLVAIDSTFLFDRVHGRFLGASLIVKDGHDNTFAYGFLRAFLRLQQKLGKCAVILLLTEDTLEAVDQDNVEYVSAILDTLGVTVCSRPDKKLLPVCVDILPSLTAIVSERNDLLQFVCQDFQVIWPRCDDKDLLYLDTNVVRKEFGVEPADIPTLLALTSGPRYSRLTKRQAQRLIAEYGGIDQIYQDIPETDKLGIKLTAFSDEILEHYHTYRAEPKQRHSQSKSIAGRTLNLNTPGNVRILRELGLYSLTRLLRAPKQ